MNYMSNIVVWSLGLFGSLGLSISSVSFAQGAKLGQDIDWERGAARLEHRLPTGKPHDFYPTRMKNLGYILTSVNYDEPDYAEYEVVRGDETYEVQIEIDPDTNRATSIDVTGNLWRAELTDWVLENPQRATTLWRDNPDYLVVIARSYRFSDRDRMQLNEMVRNLEMLPVGKTEQFYRKTLERRGYSILRKDVDRAGMTQWEAEKAGRRIALSVDFDPDTGRSREIEVHPLWWEASPAERAQRSGTEDRTARR